MDLVWRPTPVERGIPPFDQNGDGLGRQPRAEDDDDSGEYKDDRRNPKQEHLFTRAKQGPLGAA